MIFTKAARTPSTQITAFFEGTFREGWSARLMLIVACCVAIAYGAAAATLGAGAQAATDHLFNSPWQGPHPELVEDPAIQRARVRALIGIFSPGWPAVAGHDMGQMVLSNLKWL